MKKIKAVNERVCQNCIHHWACAAWNVGSIANMDGRNCANFEKENIKCGSSNADRIRAMSDEELAHQITAWSEVNEYDAILYSLLERTI